MTMVRSKDAGHLVTSMAAIVVPLLLSATDAWTERASVPSGTHARTPWSSCRAIDERLRAKPFMWRGGLVWVGGGVGSRLLARMAHPSWRSPPQHCARRAKSGGNPPVLVHFKNRSPGMGGPGGRAPVQDTRRGNPRGICLRDVARHLTSRCRSLLSTSGSRSR